MKIMFVCTGNSARSQMAEGLARSLTKDEREVHSAGIEPKGVNPFAIKIMREIDIDISKQQSKNIDYDLMKNMDLIVTLCDKAKENCPVTPPRIKTLHWSLPDPAGITGSQKEILQGFRAIRDNLKERIEVLLRDFS